MITKRLQETPTWKKVFLIVILFTLIFHMATIHVQHIGGPFGAAMWGGIKTAGNALLGWLGETDFVQDLGITNITDEIATAFDEAVADIKANLITSFFDYIFNEKLSLQLNSFNSKMFGSLSSRFASNGHTSHISTSATDVLQDISIYVSIFIATLLFGFGIIIFFLNKRITETKDTPVSLFFRYAIVIAICFLHKTIVSTIMKLFDDLHTEVLKLETGTGGALSTSNIANLVKKDSSGDFLLIGLNVGSAVNSLPLVGFGLLLIELAIYWKIIKAFFTLYMEVVARYVASVVLLMLFGIFSSTLVSNTTSNIFRSYLRMLFSSFILLIFNEVWFRMCAVAFAHNVSDMTIVKYIFILEMCHLGVKFDSMLRGMGISVATGAPNLSGAFAGAGRNLLHSAMAIDNLRRGFGQSIKASGVASGDPAKVAKGSYMSGNTTDSVQKVNIDAGTKLNPSLVSGTEKADYMATAAANGIAGKLAEQTFAADSHNMLKDGAETAIGNSLGEGFKVNNIAPARDNKGFNLDGSMSYIGKDANGNDVVKQREIKGTLVATGGTKASNAIEVGNGMSFVPASSLKKGESVSYGNSDAVIGVQAKNALTAARDSGVSGITDNTSITRKSDGYYSVRNQLDDGKYQTLGSLTQDRDGSFTWNAVGTEASRDGAFSDASSRIMNEHDDIKSVTDWQKVGRGTYEATAEYDDGRVQTYTMTDRGYLGEKASNSDDSYIISNSYAEDASEQWTFDITGGKLREKQVPGGNEASDVEMGTGEITPRKK